jgi:DnaJ-domain-containing protein 1
MPGCTENAEWRVPKAVEDMDERVWLCRSHLRAHNEKWNFFKGMSEQEIERHCLEAALGHRPTWPMGWRAAGAVGAKQAKHRNYAFDDGFAIFEEEGSRPAPPPRQPVLTKGQMDALEALGLEAAATLSEIKARYKELVKRFHPDTNGGDRSKEERLRQVIRAYGHLRATGFARGTS